MVRKSPVLGDRRVFLHGMLTYDYFAFVKALRNRQTGKWARPTNWTRISFPMAFVVFGESEKGPGGEHE